MEKVFASPSRYVQGKIFLKLVFLTFWPLGIVFSFFINPIVYDLVR